MKNQNNGYYLGLDIGTNSVGYAVTDENYNLLKHGGEPMWGSHIFDEGNQAQERRAHRSARRRNDRKKQRIELVSDIFAPEIAKVDERFFIRRRESRLFREDTAENDRYIVFNDENYTDKEYYTEYPTIHHLINELMTSDEPHDVRLVYIACAYLVAHRGHFLSEVNKDDIEKLLDFDSVYDNFIEAFETYECAKPWECDINEFKKILKEKKNITNKEKDFLELLNNGKKFKLSEEDNISKEGLVKLLSGAKYDLCKLFPRLELEEKISISFRQSEEEFIAALAILDEEADIVAALRNVYDWAVLSGVLKGGYSISAGKKSIYEQHKNDLRYLKDFIRKYKPDKYYEIFKSGKSENNYAAYSYNLKSVKAPNVKKVDKDKFCAYIKKIVDGISVEEDDRAAYEDMLFRLSMCTFMPKQVESDNRVIPYQLYYYELKKILDNAQRYLPFLLEKDSEGYVNRDKILSVMEFRIPYYVGPLRTDNGKFAWMKRKSDGKIYPWNFEEKVDLDGSEQEFIRRMTNKCTYVAGEDVLPKYSLLYCSYNVLNEINNIKINGEPVPTEHKQGIYRLFEQYRKVTLERIKNYLRSNNLLHDGDVMTGLDIMVKSSLKSYHDFKSLLERKIFTEKQVEQIIERLTYSEDKTRILRWLNREYPNLSEEDKKYVSKLKYNDFGRLSRKFLMEIRETKHHYEGGESYTVIRALWETCDNLMQLLSDKYTFTDELENINRDYYSDNPTGIDSMLNSMYISNAVKRPIYRTLDIVKDVRKACGFAPKRIFVEMARGDGVKGKRTKSRREQINELYSHMDKQEIRELSLQLEGKTDNELQSEVLFLYFMQLGVSAYSGKPLDIEKLKTSAYNVDHIYPQCRVKDDSIANKVLVLSEENADKGDKYPIKQEIRDKMRRHWDMWRKNNLISEEKYKRLIRNTSFKEEELIGFIKRQLVETRQSTKAVSTVLKTIFPESEIVYVKAGIVSDFRHEYNMLKSRAVNDNHHAKDAYLNIVVGNVYYCRFTRNFYIEQKYSLKTKTLFGGKVFDGDKEVWNGEYDLVKIKKYVSKNNIHYTRYAYMKKGGFFNQNPDKASEGLIELKKDLDTAKYGGYNDSTATGFILVKYKESGKVNVMLMPIRLMDVHSIVEGGEAAIKYAEEEIEKIWDKKGKISDIEFPLGMRFLKVNTMLSFDGFRACIKSKSNKGKTIVLTSMMPLVIGNKWERYVKKLESFDGKKIKNGNIQLNQMYDGISYEENVQLYDILCKKVSDGIYFIPFSSQKSVLMAGRNKFEKELSIDEQLKVLLEMVLLLKSGRSGDCDFSKIEGSKKAGTYSIGSKLNNWKGKFNDVRIIDISASGIYEKQSFNLMELI